MQRGTGIPVACFGHSGDGNIHTNIMVLKDAQGRDIREPADALDLHRALKDALDPRHTLNPGKMGLE